VGGAGALAAALAALGWGFGSGLGSAALADLTLRICPRGREAFGYALVTAPRAILGLPISMALANSDVSSHAFTAFATGAGLLAAVLVVLLPRDLVAAPDRPPPDRAA
jgi:hypothetical protein